MPAEPSPAQGRGIWALQQSDELENVREICHALIKEDLMPTNPWVDGLTFAEVLTQTVERFGRHDALAFPHLGYRRTYREFQAEVRETARALLAIGIQRGEHVGIWATNWPQWVIVQFATAQVGAVLVNINPAYRAHELAYVLNQADITTLFLTDRFRSSSFFDILAEVCPELSGCASDDLRAPACPKLRRLISIQPETRPGIWSWNDFRRQAASVSDADLDCREKEGRAGDIVNIQYTSGTTGFPKGAMLSHRNLLMNAYYVGQRLAFTNRDRLCIPVPFYHCFGCVMGTLMCAIYGAAMVIPAEAFNPLATLEAIQAERCTAVYGVPTMFIAELNHPRFAEFDLSSLRTGIMAGSPCPIEVMREVVHKMGVRDITIAYGLTEASPVITQTEAADSLEHRVGTVGRVLPDLEVQIVAEPGQPGELIVRGHGVMKGYYNKPAETAEALTEDGWLHTGDVAVQTPDGYYRITGRIKDMIIRGGENIYPREIEEFLYTHPQIADVQVVGLPDLALVEEVCAWIRLKPGAALTEEDIKRFCRGRIAHYKIPRYVAFVEEFPTTVTGKVQKFKLREMGIERFGLQKAASVETA
jgi:fatty-acyl-CoA synthase